MKLIITEKPSVAQSIASVLGAKNRKDGYIDGNGYIVSWCLGHLFELTRAESYGEKYSKWRREDLPIIPAKWEFVISKGKNERFSVLRELMQRSDVTEVINACDAGREGELIFRTVYNMAGCKKPIKRLWISSMEDEAIRNGFENLRHGSDYDGLYSAALCRAKADWLVGINATRLFSTVYHRTLNVGRVLSPTLAMLVSRESQISGFTPKSFYTVNITSNGMTAVSERFEDMTEAAKLADLCRSNSVIVKRIERKEKSEKAPCFTTLQLCSEMQTESSATPHSKPSTICSRFMRRSSAHIRGRTADISRKICRKAYPKLSRLRCRFATSALPKPFMRSKSATARKSQTTTQLFQPYPLLRLMFLLYPMVSEIY